MSEPIFEPVNAEATRPPSWIDLTRETPGRPQTGGKVGFATGAFDLFDVTQLHLLEDARTPPAPGTEDRLHEIGVHVTHLHADPTGQAAPTTVRGNHDRLRSAQKPARGVSLYSSKVNRPAGRWIAALGAKLRLTPDQITWASALVSLVGVVLVAVPTANPLTGALAGLALMAAFALDSADGQLARLRGGGTAAGEWLDHVVDCGVKILLHAAVLVAWYRAGVTDTWLFVPLLFLLASLVLFQGGTLAAKLHEGRGGGKSEATGVRRFSAVLLLPVDHGVICAAFLLWGFPQVFAPVYLVLALAHTAMLVALSRQWYLQLSRQRDERGGAS